MNFEKKFRLYLFYSGTQICHRKTFVTKTYSVEQIFFLKFSLEFHYYENC